MTAIAERIEQVLESIASACSRVQRDPSDVTLVAVSKTKSVENIIDVFDAGLQHFGENRVEEASVKIPQVNQRTSSQPVWHMVGHIQSRKAKNIPSLFDCVHSVDSLKLANRLSHFVEEDGAKLDVLLEINISGEHAKSGFAAARWSQYGEIRDRLWRDIGEVLKLPGLHVCGLMTMAPIVMHAEQTRAIFAGLAQLRDSLVESFEISLPELSMGMTDDYPIAIEEGATIVRIGRAIFGSREQ